jgi:hypothetical protein
VYTHARTHARTHTHTHRYDPATGKPFYINHTTKTTQWDPPTAPPVAHAAAAVQQHQQQLVIIKSPLYDNFKFYMVNILAVKLIYTVNVLGH